MNSNTKKILVVEDEESLSMIVIDQLKQEGYEVFGAKNGQEGLEMALKEHPDLILLDTIMPVLDGIGMLKKLRQDDWGKSASVVFFTNLSDTNNMEAAKLLGVNDYFVKSDWDLNQVLEKIKTKLN